MKNEKLFKTDPAVSFRQYLNENMASDNLNEALEIAKKNGYKVVNEGALKNAILGLALSFGLLTNAQAKDLNDTVSYTSKSATVNSVSKNLQKTYNMQSNGDIAMTDVMVRNIAKLAVNNISNRFVDCSDPSEIEDSEELANAKAFYVQVSKSDPSLGNMFKRTLEQQLNKILGLGIKI